VYKNNHPISIEKTEIFTTKEGNIEESELRKRKKKLQKEVLDGVMSFDTVEYVDSSYHRDGEHLIGKAYMKQALNNDTNSETLIGLTLPFTKHQIEKKMIRDVYKKYYNERLFKSFVFHYSFIISTSPKLSMLNRLERVSNQSSRNSLLKTAFKSASFVGSPL